MSKIKVGMLLLPHMLRAILNNSVGKEPDVELVDLADGEGLSSLCGNLDAVLVPCDEDRPDSVWPFLANQPNMAVLALNRDAKLAQLFEFRHESLGEPSEENLLATIRRVGQRTANSEGK